LSSPSNLASDLIRRLSAWSGIGGDTSTASTSFSSDEGSGQPFATQAPVLDDGALLAALPAPLVRGSRSRFAIC
jgi:hypothetical protein